MFSRFFSPENAKILMGLFLVFAGIWNIRDGLKKKCFPACGGIDRENHPWYFWFVFAVCVAAVLSGIDLIISGTVHVHTFWG
jgi:hypothetical protein